MTSIISEGKTTNEAIENGLKRLNASKKDVDIKVIEEEKRSFFKYLQHRIWRCHEWGVCIGRRIWCLWNL